MGRGRAKGKKLSQDDQGSGEEEKIPAQKRRGRPQKPLKDEIDEDETIKIEDEDSEEITHKDATKYKARTTSKRKMEEKVDAGKEEEEESNRVKTNSNGFRHHGSRRKSTPRRAAEAVLECS